MPYNYNELLVNSPLFSYVEYGFLSAGTSYLAIDNEMAMPQLNSRFNY